MRTELLILLMALATIVPRIIPCAITRQAKLPGRVASFLKAIPFAALGALIFPGILSVSENAPHHGIIAACAAAVVAALTRHVLATVVTAIGVIFVLQLVLS